MGWFALPATIEEVEFNKTVTGANLGYSNQTEQVLEPLEQPRLDRKWEITSINLPLIRFSASALVISSKPKSKPLNAEYTAAWEPTWTFNYSVGIIVGGLLVGALSESLTLPPSYLFGVGEVYPGFAYDSGPVTVSDTLPSPIFVQGPESIKIRFTVSTLLTTLKPFIHEYEEGSGESKHTVKEEIKPESIEINESVSTVAYGLSQNEPKTLLYINESDKEGP